VPGRWRGTHRQIALKITLLDQHRRRHPATLSAGRYCQAVPNSTRASTIATATGAPRPTCKRLVAAIKSVSFVGQLCRESDRYRGRGSVISRARRCQLPARLWRISRSGGPDARPSIVRLSAMMLRIFAQSTSFTTDSRRMLEHCRTRNGRVITPCKSFICAIKGDGTTGYYVGMTGLSPEIRRWRRITIAVSTPPESFAGSSPGVWLI
jgi:hypothetical protein